MKPIRSSFRVTATQSRRHRARACGPAASATLSIYLLYMGRLCKLVHKSPRLTYLNWSVDSVLPPQLRAAEWGLVDGETDDQHTHILATTYPGHVYPYQIIHVCINMNSEARRLSITLCEESLN